MFLCGMQERGGRTGEEASGEAVLANPDTSGSPVRRFGQFELLERLGRGSSGIVYKARQTRLGRLVALKLIAPELDSGDFRQRLEREANTVGSLDHPHIVALYEAGEWEGQPYLCMKLVEGMNLSERIRASRVTSDEAARLLIQLARAVHYAHQRGILHRDLKPGNVLVDQAGNAYLTDFGLAKLLEVDHGLTRTLAVMGTPGYMSPEQAAGNTKNLTTAADVYGLGAVMYELLTAQPPFAGCTAMETMRQVLDKEPKPPSQLVPKVPRDLEVICLKCLEKDPRRRYSSAEALAEDLERWRWHEPISARPTTPLERVQRWVQRHPLGALLGSVTLLVSVTLFIAMTALSVRLAVANKQVIAKAEESQRRLVRLNVATGNRGIREKDYLRALPWFIEALRLDQGDAKHEDTHRYRLHAALQQAPKLERIFFHSNEVQVVEFSPDGGRLLTAGEERAARIWDLATGAAVTSPLQHDATVSMAKFHPDGGRVATLSVDGVARIWDAATGQPLSPPLPHREFRPVSDRYAAVLWFSKDGGQLLSVYGSPYAHIWEVATGELLRTLPHAEVVYDAAFSPDGRYIVTTCEDRYVRTWRAATGELVGPPIRHHEAPAWSSFSPDGQRLLTVADRRTVQIWDWKRGTPIGSPMNHQNVLNTLFLASFSPDGTQVLTASWDNTARLWDAATGRVRARLNHSGGVLSAAFSPDGQHVATASWDGSARIWDAATGEPLLSAMPQGASLLRVAFRRDGKRLAASSVNGTVRVWNIEVGDGANLRLAHEGAAWAEFSANQRWIVTGSGESEGGIRLWDAADGRPMTPLLLRGTAVDQARFTRDGKSFLSVSRDHAVRIWDIQTGQETIPALLHPQPVRSISLSSDGKSVLTVCHDGLARVWETETGKRSLPDLSPGPGERPAVLEAVFSPKNDLIATTCADGVQLWNRSTGRRVLAPLRHRGPVNRASFSQDGARLVTICAARNRGGNYVQVWDPHTGLPVTSEIIHVGTVLDVAFSPDRHWVATASSDGAARIWDAATGNPLTPPLWHPSSVRQVLFSPDGQRLASASEDGTVLLWDALLGEMAAPPLQEGNRHDRIRVSFSSDGRRLLIARAREVVWVERLDKTDRPLEELGLQAQVLSAHHVDSVGGQIALDLTNMRSAWERWQALPRNRSRLRPDGYGGQAPR